MFSLVSPGECCAMTEGEGKPATAGRKVARSKNAAGRQPTTHPIVELTLTRIREFVREPEVIFWVFIFPVLLACALGIAFRNTGPEKIRVAVADDGQSAGMGQILAALEKSADVIPVVLGSEAAARALRTGNVALVVRAAEPATSNPGSFPQLVYRYDPTRPETRTARLAVDAAIAQA